MVQTQSCFQVEDETAAGQYPVEAVTMMANIAVRVEKSLQYEDMFKNVLKSSLQQLQMH